MQYRTMKKTGDRLSALGFGCMRLPKKGGAVDEERHIEENLRVADEALPGSLTEKERALIGRKGYASRCKGCNRCVEVCTQHIDIPAELKKVAKAMEGPETKVLDLVFRPVMSRYMRYDRWRNRRRGRA